MNRSHVVCAVCGWPIGDAPNVVWADPGGVSVIAHRTCLRRLGEHELGISP